MNNYGNEIYVQRAYTVIWWDNNGEYGTLLKLLAALFLLRPTNNIHTNINTQSIRYIIQQSANDQMVNTQKCIAFLRLCILIFI